MADPNCGGSEESLTAPIHFFKIIYDTINRTKLRIPGSFVKKHGDDALQSSPVYATDPAGNSWHIELSKDDDGEVWLEEGWQEFAEYYSLDYGYFLTFRFEGGSDFHVVIFDKSGCEIDYPLYTNLVSIQANNDIGSFKNVDVKKDEGVSGTSKCTRRAITDCLVKNRSSTLQAVEVADKFISESKYPSFKCIKTARPHHQTLSFTFISKHFERNTQVTLKVADRSWRVSLYCSLSHRTSAFGGGWTAFAAENCLEAGDVCVFELVEKSVMQVSIFRRNSSC